MQIMGTQKEFENNLKKKLQEYPGLYVQSV